MAIKITATFPILISALLAVNAYSSTPADDVGDAQLLTDATQEVDRLNAQQLDSFIDYLSMCSTTFESQQRDLLCDVATKEFLIRNVASKALTRLTLAMDVSAGGRSAERKGYADRKAEIYKTLETQAGIRYLDLGHGK